MLETFRNALLTRGRIFISYSRSDQEVASQIAMALRNARFEVFLDKDDLPAGGDFISRIRNAIMRSDVVVFLLSAEALDDGRYVRSEIAATEGRWPSPLGHVLPVMIRPFPFSKLPEYLSSLTILQPSGSQTAEVVDAIEAMQKWGRRSHRLLLAGLSVAVIVGFTFWQVAESLDRRELYAAHNLVLQEVRSNADIVDDLHQNASTFFAAVAAVSESVRRPQIKTLAGLFPASNIDPNVDMAEQTNLYDERADWLAESGLLQNELEMRRAKAACDSIARVVARTITTVRSLADLDGERYEVKTTSWLEHRAILVNAEDRNPDDLAQIYDRMTNVRRSYDRVAAASIDYLDTMHRFCTSSTINRAGLSEVLAAERLSFHLLHTHMEELKNISEELVPSLTGP